MANYRSQSAFVSQKVFWALVIAAVAITPHTILAAKIINVGGAKGWDLDVDYVAWAKGTKFRVGDQLIFKYPKGAHNVRKVTKKEYDNCDIKSGKLYKSGVDTIKLSSPGKSWFICGVPEHCKKGQKLVINVKPKL